MGEFKVIHDKIDKYIHLLVVGYYPTLNEVHHFGFATKAGINKDKFMYGVWKIKYLKNK
jgi:hypothetical protein